MLRQIVISDTVKMYSKATLIVELLQVLHGVVAGSQNGCALATECFKNDSKTDYILLILLLSSIYNLCEF